MDTLSEKLFGPILRSPNAFQRRPQIGKDFESNVPGLHIIGDLAGAPVVKLAMEQGYDVARKIAAELREERAPEGEFDVIVAGAGASGLNAALELKQQGFSGSGARKEPDRQHD